MTLAQRFSTVFGGVYVLVGIIGFIPFIGGTFTQDPDQLLGIFGITAAHNVVHLAIGLAFLAASRTESTARLVSTVIGATYLLVGMIGLLNLDIVNDLLNINGADNVLHFASGIAGLAIGLMPSRAVTA